MTRKDVTNLLKKVSINQEDFEDYVQNNNDLVLWEDYEDDILRKNDKSGMTLLLKIKGLKRIHQRKQFLQIA